MRPIGATKNYGRFDTTERPLLYASLDSNTIFNEVEDKSKYNYEITYALKRPIKVVMSFLYEQSQNHM